MKNSGAGVRSVTRPACRNRMSSARRFACTRLCVVMTIVVPRAWMSAMIRSTERAAAGSRLAVGSSRNRTSGRSAQTRASASFCCSPPESTRAGRADSASNPTSSSASAMRVVRFVSAHAGQVQRVATFASAERRNSTGRWNTIACPRGLVLCAAPVDRAALGGMSPCSTRSSVLLPAPLGPSRTVRATGSTTRSMSASDGHAARRTRRPSST